MILQCWTLLNGVLPLLMLTRASVFWALLELQWSKMALPTGCQLEAPSELLTRTHLHSHSLCLGFLTAWNLGFKESILREKTLKLLDFQNVCLHSEVFEWYFLCVVLFKTVTGPARMQREEHTSSFDGRSSMFVQCGIWLFTTISVP